MSVKFNPSAPSPEVNKINKDVTVSSGRGPSNPPKDTMETLATNDAEEGCCPLQSYWNQFCTCVGSIKDQIVDFVYGVYLFITCQEKAVGSISPEKPKQLDRDRFIQDLNSIMDELDKGQLDKFTAVMTAVDEECVERLESMAKLEEAQKEKLISTIIKPHIEYAQFRMNTIFVDEDISKTNDEWYRRLCDIQDPAVGRLVRYEQPTLHHVYLLGLRGLCAQSSNYPDVDIKTLLREYIDCTAEILYDIVIPKIGQHINQINSASIVNA